MTLPRHGCSFLALLRYASAVTAASVAGSRFKGRLFFCYLFDPKALHRDGVITLSEVYQLRIKIPPFIEIFSN